MNYVFQQYPSSFLMVTLLIPGQTVAAFVVESRKVDVNCEIARYHFYLSSLFQVIE